VTDLTSLDIADPPELWRTLGFTIDEGSCWVSGIRHQLGATGRGVVSWGLRAPAAFSELPTRDGVHHVAHPTPQHPNGVVALDHVVIATPYMARTVEAFESSGMPLRRTRDAGSVEQPVAQSFFKAGEVIIEVVGSPAAAGPGPSRFWGLTYTVSDLNATAELLGDQLRPIREAVQSGRRIATLDRSVGSTVPMAFMSGPR
jgi:hypothetical protein